MRRHRGNAAEASRQRVNAEADRRFLGGLAYADALAAVAAFNLSRHGLARALGSLPVHRATRELVAQRLSELSAGGRVA